MTDNYSDFFLGESGRIIELVEKVDDKEMMKFFQETDGYVVVPISDPITEDLRILHRGIFPTSSYFAERDRARVKNKKNNENKKNYNLKNNDTKYKNKNFIDSIKGIFSPFDRKDQEDKMVIVESKTNKRLLE